jgi:hypothetical protein
VDECKPLVNGCVELELMLRGLAALEPDAGVPPVGQESVEGALSAASSATCGWITRCNLPARLGAAEAGAYTRPLLTST